MTITIEYSVSIVSSPGEKCAKSAQTGVDCGLGVQFDSVVPSPPDKDIRIEYCRIRPRGARSERSGPRRRGHQLLMLYRISIFLLCFWLVSSSASLAFAQGSEYVLG